MIEQYLEEGSNWKQEYYRRQKLGLRCRYFKREVLASSSSDSDSISGRKSQPKGVSSHVDLDIDDDVQQAAKIDESLSAGLQSSLVLTERPGLVTLKERPGVVTLTERPGLVTLTPRMSASESNMLLANSRNKSEERESNVVNEPPMPKGTSIFFKVTGEGSEDDERHWFVIPAQRLH